MANGIQKQAQGLYKFVSHMQKKLGVPIATHVPEHGKHL